MDIYLDANATTPVLAQARAAALAAMAEDFGNPSSVHSTGLKARALMDAVRAQARQLLGAHSGSLLFLSGATEGIQTAVLSALNALRERQARGEPVGRLLIYGATEHKAVPEALRHWNTLLGLDLELRALPVDLQGRHRLDLLAEWAPEAAMVCTMAANNETGVITDLAAIETLVRDRAPQAFWMVDGVQALGKLALDLSHSRIDYAPFSGHKLYAPKGIGLLYVREGAPFTPLMAGGGQEGSLRSGTENMSGIAALGAVLRALDDGHSFRDAGTLYRYRDRLVAALRAAFRAIVFNAPLHLSLPTTINFSVPGLSSKLLQDLFDAADVRVSGGSACSAAKAQPSFVLEAMGLPPQQTASAIRLSFGPAVTEAFIDEACARIATCGQALRRNCLSPDAALEKVASQGVTRFVVDGACAWLVADETTRSAVVIDPLPGLTDRLAQLLHCQDLKVLAVLDTHSHADHASSRAELVLALGPLMAAGACDPLGWPEAIGDTLSLGALSLQRLPLPGHTDDSVAFVLRGGADATPRLVFCGDTVMPGALGRTDFRNSQPLALFDTLRRLAAEVGEHTLLCSAHDYDNQFATTLAVERGVQPLLDSVLAMRLDAASFASMKAGLDAGIGASCYDTLACGARSERPAIVDVQLRPEGLADWLAEHTEAVLVDVREPYEHLLSLTPPLMLGRIEAMPLSRLVHGLSRWVATPERPLVFFCRSGNRSQQAVQALRRLGHTNCWHLEGGLALWPQPLAGLRAAVDDAALLI